MKAKSIKGNSIETIKGELENVLKDHFTPTLAIVFISIKQDRDAVCNLLHQNKIDVLGATSSTEFKEGYQEEGTMVILLLDLDREYYTIYFESVEGKTISKAASNLANAAFRRFKNPSFILLSTSLKKDGTMLDGEALIRAIENTVGKQVNLFGGMAGDDMTFSGTYVFTHQKSTNYGFVALVLNEEKVGMQGMAISGWKPVGVFKTITGSEGNKIFTIDNEPALDIYMRYLGSAIPESDDQLVFFENLGNQYPLQVERKNRVPKMCNPIGFDKKEKALVLESEVEQGMRFRFSTPPDFDIVETIVQNADKLKSADNAKADALLIFSCAGRLASLGPLAQQENEGLQQIWNAPMAGFFAYGEYGKGLDGKHEYHSTTCSWVVLKEKVN